MAKNWIAKAISKPGALKKKAAAAGESTKEFASAHAGDKGKTGAQSRLAETLMGFHHAGKAKNEARKKSGGGSKAHKLYAHLD